MLFKKAAIFTDIHFGKKQDSEEHNKDCRRFLIWFIDNVKKHNCDVIIFMGDWFENRIRTENRTGEYSRQGIEILNSLEIPIFWLLGNHDIYYTGNRDVHSLPHSGQYRNINLVEEITTVDDVIFSPWLINNEYKELLSLNGKYIFSHLELPLFYQNQTFIKKYEEKGIHPDMFDGIDAIYSGHYHKRQVKINKNNIPIHYIGNCFPHDFNDLHDNDRGMAILEWGKKQPDFYNWDDAPSYHRIITSDLLKRLEEGSPFNKRSIIELIDDINLSSDNMNDIRELLKVRLIKPKKLTKQEITPNIAEHTQYNSLDDMIIDQLKKLNYGGNYDPNLLIEIYRKI